MKWIVRNKWVVMLMILTIAMILASISGGWGIDSGLFNQGGCEPPCWHNLTPGISSANDVDDFLSNLSRINWPVRNFFVPGVGCESIQLRDKFRLGSVSLYMADDKLTFIQIIHPIKIKLEKIVDYFGNPEYFMAISEIGVDYRTYTLEVYYPGKGLGFEIDLDLNKSIDGIRPDMEISAIHYFEPGDLSSYYLSRSPCSLDAFYSEKFVQKWHGFGPVDVMIYDPLAPNP